MYNPELQELRKLGSIISDTISYKILYGTLYVMKKYAAGMQ